MDLSKLGQDKAKTQAPQTADKTNESTRRAETDDSGSNESSTSREAVMYSSHPISRFKLGRFQFERGLLTLNESDDIDEFEKLLNSKTLPARDRRQIRKIDTKAAERLVRPPEPGMTKSFDSSVGRQQETVGGGNKVVGDEPLEGVGVEKFTKVAQTDANKPVTGSEDQHVVNEQNQGDVDTRNQG